MTLAFPKPIKKKKARKWRIATKSKFLVRENPFKTYKVKSPEEINRLAHECRANQLDENGQLKWKGEIALKVILDRIDPEYEVQVIFFRPGSYNVVDFLYRRYGWVIEADGDQHVAQHPRDIKRDRYFEKTWGLRTLRIPNKKIFAQPAYVESLVRRALGL